MIQNLLTSETAGYISFKKAFPTIHRVSVERNADFGGNRIKNALLAVASPSQTLRFVA